MTGLREYIDEQRCNIVISVVREHFDEKCMEHCDDKVHGAL